jgi:hypothetical protein
MLDGYKFDVRFEMEPVTERLIAIRIVDGRYETYVSPDPDKFARLEALLTQKYGPANLRTDVDRTRERPMQTALLMRSWSFATTTIELRQQWFRVGPTKPSGFTQIRFIPMKSGDSKKL